MHTIPFEHLLASHLRGVHRLAIGLIGNEQVGHEVAQEALTKAWRARDSYDRSRPFAPWLFRIVRNSCKDAQSRRARQPTSPMDPERVLSSAPSPVEILSQADAEALLQQAIQGLSEDHREIIALRHFQELTYAEIAEVLNIPQPTVMSRLYRARRSLTRRLEDQR